MDLAQQETRDKFSQDHSSPAEARLRLAGAMHPDTQIPGLEIHTQISDRSQKQVRQRLGHFHCSGTGGLSPHTVFGFSLPLMIPGLGSSLDKAAGWARVSSWQPQLSQEVVCHNTPVKAGLWAGLETPWAPPSCKASLPLGS